MLKRFFCLALCWLAALNCFGTVVLSDSLERASIGKQLSVLRSDRELSFEEVLHAAAFKPVLQAIPNLGTDKHSVWLRFEVSNQSKLHHFLLEVAYPILDETDLYTADSLGRYSRIRMGESIPFNNRIYQYPTYIFDLELPPGTQRTFYLRVKSSEQLILPIYINKPVALWASVSEENLVSGMYLGIILIMVVYNLFLFFSVRDKSYIYYVIYVLFVGLTQIGIKGYTYQYLWPNSPYFESKSVVLCAALACIAASLFTRDFLHVKDNFPRVNKLLSALIVFFALSIVLVFINQDQAGFLVMQLTTTAFSLIVFFVSLATMIKGYTPATFFFIAWSILLTGSFIFLFKDYGLLPYNMFTRSIVQVTSAIEMALLSFALANRINILKKEKEQSRLAALRIAKENSRIIKEQNVILEQKVRIRTEELETKTAEIAAALADLQQAQMQLVEAEKMASLGQLTAGIAHEINNPINFVTGNIGPLKRDVDILLHIINLQDELNTRNISDEEKIKETNRFKEEQDFDYLKTEISYLLKGINEGASRTAEIVKSLRIFSRLDEADLKLADINEGLESTIVIVNNMLGHIKVNRHYGNLPLVHCYPGKLNQVFLNIISNALFAINERFGNAPGGELTVTTSCTDEQVSIIIEDNGTGMSDETRRKVFEPFFTTKDVGQGTGLGMSIAFTTIQKHNGSISVSSELGKGTIFNLQIPIQAPEAAV